MLYVDEADFLVRSCNMVRMDVRQENVEYSKIYR